MIVLVTRRNDRACQTYVLQDPMDAVHEPWCSEAVKRCYDNDTFQISDSGVVRDWSIHHTALFETILFIILFVMIRINCGPMAIWIWIPSSDS